MISQPRIAVLGLSQPYDIYRRCLLITSSSCTRVSTYLGFELRFKPSAELYLRILAKTKKRHLGLLQSLLFSNSSSFIRLPRGLVSVHYYKGVKCLRTLYSYPEVSLCLISQVTLRSSTFVSSIVYLAKSHVFHHFHSCLSQAYGCSDRYNRALHLASSFNQEDISGCLIRTFG